MNTEEKLSLLSTQVAIVITKVDALERKLDDHMKNGGFFSGMDKTTIVKLAALTLAALVAGSAGGQSLIDLIRFVLGWGG